jgi:D-glycero-D-manno-heptose 1,7-bisphosphate phosphatase
MRAASAAHRGDAGRSAVFLDKDGTLIEDIPYNADRAKMRLLPGVAEGLQFLGARRYALVVVSNQAGVARGIFDEGKLPDIASGLRELLAPHGVRLTAVYFCPHSPDGVVRRFAQTCACRKPAPGLLLRAAREHRLDLQRSWLIGDILHDVEAAHRAGCKAVLVNNGNETEWESGPGRVPDAVVADFAEAARFIAQSDGVRASRVGPAVHVHG